MGDKLTGRGTESGGWGRAEQAHAVWAHGVTQGIGQMGRQGCDLICDRTDRCDRMGIVCAPPLPDDRAGALAGNYGVATYPADRGHSMR